jgi:hypothetical protein
MVIKLRRFGNVRKKLLRNILGVHFCGPPVMFYHYGGDVERVAHLVVSAGASNTRVCVIGSSHSLVIATLSDYQRLCVPVRRRSQQASVAPAFSQDMMARK